MKKVQRKRRNLRVYNKYLENKKNITPVEVVEVNIEPEIESNKKNKKNKKGKRNKKSIKIILYRYE